MSMENRVPFHRIPEHKMIQVKEKADRCAKQGSASGFVRPELAVDNYMSHGTDINLWVPRKHYQRWNVLVAFS